MFPTSGPLFNTTAPIPPSPLPNQLPSAPPAAPPIPIASFAENPVASTTPPSLSPPQASISPKDQTQPESGPDTTLETLAASLPQEALVDDSLAPPDPAVPPAKASPDTPAPASPSVLPDLLIDVMQHIESGKDSAAAIGITKLIKNGYTNEALQLYHTLVINRTTRQ
jgi:hypothetical protein